MCKTDHEAGQTPRYRGDGMFSQFCIVDEKRDMVVCCVSGVPDIGKALDLIYDHLLAAADMPPADEAEQATLQEQLAALTYPWPEHDGSALPVGVYASEDAALYTGRLPHEGSITLTITENRVLLEIPPHINGVMIPGQVMSEGSNRACCGMQDGLLRIAARGLDRPFSADISCRFEGDK